jgi:hypothetical protein
MKNTPKFLALLAALLFCSSAAFANTYTFATPTGSTDTALDPVSATATFTTGAGTLSITLNNTLANQKDAGQLLSDLFFTLSSGTTASITNSSGVERTIASNGTFTDGASVSTGWVLTSAAGVYHLDGLNGAANVPAHEIVGGPDGSNVYSAANSSIAGNGPHNPFLAGNVTFNLAITGVTAATSVNSATFSFGTTSGDNVPGSPRVPSVPDGGATLMLLGAGLAGLGTMRRFMKR